MNKYTIEAVKDGDYIKLIATIPDEVIAVGDRLTEEGWHVTVMASPLLLRELIRKDKENEKSENQTE